MTPPIAPFLPGPPAFCFARRKTVFYFWCMAHHTNTFIFPLRVTGCLKVLWVAVNGLDEPLFDWPGFKAVDMVLLLVLLFAAFCLLGKR